MKHYHKYTKTYLLTVLLTTLIVFNGCAPRSRPLTEAEALRQELGVSQSIKWNSGVVNQVQMFNSNGLKIEERWLNPRGFIVTSRILEYDEKTLNLVQVDWFKAGGVKKSKELYAYDGKNNLVEKQTLTPFDDVTLKIEYSYKKGNLTGEKLYGSRSNLISERTYRYANGNRTEFIEVNNRGNITNHQTYFYNEYGKRVREKWYFDKDSPQTIRTFSYENDRLAQEVRFKGDGEIEHTVEHKYDPNGLILFERWVDGEGQIITENSYTYSYH